MYSLQFATALELIRQDIIVDIKPISDIIDFIIYIDKTLKHHPNLDDSSIKLLYRRLSQRRTFYAIIVKQSDLDQYLISKNILFFNETSKDFTSCLRVLMIDGNMLMYVPDDVENPRLLYVTAVSQNGMALEFVPVRMRDRELCKLAVQNRAPALMHVPDVLRTDESYMHELYTIAMNQNSYSGSAIILIPPEHRSYEFSLKAVSMNGMMLEHVTDEVRCLQIYETALNNNGLALQFVHEADRSEHLCEIAVSQDGLALEFVTQQTHDIRLAALHQNGQALRYIPEPERAFQYCHIAVTYSPGTLELVPANRFVPYIVETAILRDGSSLRYVHQDDRSETLCILAVLNDGSALQYVSPSKMTDYMIKIAIDQFPMALEYVPLYLKTKMLCEMAIEQNPWALQFVPLELLTDELCENAISRVPMVIQFVPNSKRTETMIMLAITKDIDIVFLLDDSDYNANICKYILTQKPNMIRRIPERFRTIDMFYLVVSRYPIVVKHVTINDAEWKLFTYVALSIDPYVFWSINRTIRDMTHTLLFVHLDKINMMYFSKADRESLRGRLNDPLISEDMKNFVMISKNPKTFMDIPPSKITIELCQIAVRLDGMNIQWLPDSGLAESIRMKLFIIAAEQNPRALRFIPYEYTDDEFYRNITNNEEFANTYMPEFSL